MRNHKGLLIGAVLLLNILMCTFPAQAALLQAKTLSYTFSAEIWDKNYTAFDYNATTGYYVMAINGTSIFGAEGTSEVFFDIYADGILVLNSRSNSFNVQGLKASNIKIITHGWGKSNTYNGAITIGCDVADNATLIQARDSANAANAAAGQARDAANTAGNNALNAYNSVYNANGNTITAVRDSGGTVLYEARQAKTNAANANTNAANASNNAWYNGSTYGGSAQSVGNVAGYIAYSQLPAINQGLNQKIDNLSKTINNFTAADTSPPVVNLTTVSGSKATSGNSIKIIVGVSDNVSSTFTYSLDGIGYQPLPADRIITAPINGFGAVPINVWVKDEANNLGMSCIVIRKI